jgi:hypothetical protein
MSVGKLEAEGGPILRKSIKEEGIILRTPDKGC